MNALILKKTLRGSTLALVAMATLMGADVSQAQPVLNRPALVANAQQESAVDARALAPQAGAANASGPGLKNLTTVGASIADGDKACPDQPYYLYSGGKPDNFAGPTDLAYPSPNLAAFIPAGGQTVAYDVPMADGRFGDSFNLQNTRGVCYAVIQFKAQASNGGSQNDGLTLGHVNNGGSPFDIVAQVINPGALPNVQSYALTAAGRNLLGAQTGWGGGKTPAQSVLDLYLQDDTKLDFFRMFVWYGPRCGLHGNSTTSSDC
jgi:hypothetical protein